MKRHKYQLAALMMSVIIATGSLSGSVFAAETSGDTAESSVVEEIEESEQSETEDEKADEDSGNESDQETEKLEEDTTQQTEKSVKDAENAEEQGLSIPAEIGNNSEKEKEDLSSGSVNTPTEKNDTKGAVEDKRKTTEGEDKAVIDIPVEQETVIIDEESEKGFSSLDFESDQNEIIPEETVEMHVGERYNAVSYSHEDNESVRFEIDPNLPIGLLGVIDVADGYTTSSSSCCFLPLGKGSGLIKVIDDSSGKVLKNFKIVIDIYEEEVTLCKGSYTWTTLWYAPTPSYSWDNSDGVEITFRRTEELFEPDDYLAGGYTLYDCYYAVKGKQVGDFPITFYSGEREYHKIIYHVVDHDYHESAILKETTCTEGGIIEKECSYCHNKITEKIPETGHTWNEEYTVDKEATCTEEGSESIHCSVCGEIDEETVRAIPKKEHAYNDWTVTKEATCMEDGNRERICEDCGDKVLEVIPATGHTWNEKYTVDKEATCTEEGSESIHCSVCDVIQDSSSHTIPKTAHEYGDWTVAKEATCTEAGTKEKTCKDCNDKVTEIIPATGHTWNEEYTVDKEATYTEDGSESIHCSICGDIKEGTSRPIARLRKPMSMLAVSGIVDKTYTGVALTQEIVIQDGIEKLKDGTDYTVSYSNNVNAGTAKVNITGLGLYTGEISKTFTIAKAAQNLNIVADSNMILVGKATKVTASGAKETSEYTFSSSDPAVATIDPTGTVTGKAAGTATITVSTVETPNYKAGSKTVDITINEIAISGYSDKIYNGQPQTQTPVIKLNGTALTEGVDYSVSYSNNVNAGKATMTITGIGLYEGITTSTSFTIAKAAQNFNVKAGASNIEIGKTTKVTASGTKENPKFTFTSSNTKVATVDASGTVTGKAAGTVTITVKAAATTNYKELSKTVKITVNKVLKKPGNCHFTKWNNSKYTGCRISWNKVDGAEGYQTLLSWTDGSHSSATIVKSNVLYRDCTVHPQHVSQMKVRAFYTLNGQRKYGPWSNVEYITPSPAKLTTKNASSGSNLKMNISWNIIYGCNGYNVFITTNPNGKWYWNQSTTEKATATSASIDKCGGAKLKKNTRYYVRIVTRRKRNGVFCTVPMPANNTYIGSFVIN